MLGVASARVARVSAAPMAAPTADELETHLNCPLVVIGGELADRLGIADRLTDQKRCTAVSGNGSRSSAFRWESLLAC
jgi:hypothetical protein